MSYESKKEGLTGERVVGGFTFLCSAWRPLFDLSVCYMCVSEHGLVADTAALTNNKTATCMISTACTCCMKGAQNKTKFKKKGWGWGSNESVAQFVFII
jgi:hypothetical protein